MNDIPELQTSVPDCASVPLEELPGDKRDQDSAVSFNSAV